MEYIFSVYVVNVFVSTNTVFYSDYRYMFYQIPVYQGKLGPPAAKRVFPSSWLSILGT